MDNRERQRQDSAKIVGWVMIGFILSMVSYLIYILIEKIWN